MKWLKILKVGVLVFFTVFLVVSFYSALALIILAYIGGMLGFIAYITVGMTIAITGAYAYVNFEDL